MITIVLIAASHCKGAVHHVCSGTWLAALSQVVRAKWESHAELVFEVAVDLIETKRPANADLSSVTLVHCLYSQMTRTET